MSRTDKTRPFWVKKRDARVLRPRMTSDERVWEHKTFEWWRGEFRCSCSMCSMGMKEEGRKERYAGKREARNQQLE